MYERKGALLESKFREYLIPTILLTVAISIANAVDSVIVGNLLGEDALSAVGLSMPVIFSFNAVFVLFAAGGVICASVAKGRRDIDGANRLFTLTLTAGLAAMFLLLAALLAFMGPITDALAQGDATLAALTRAYLTPTVFVAPVLMLTAGMAQFVRMDGKPRFSAYIVIMANVANLLLTYVFVKFLNMGIAGAGLGTVLGYMSGFFVVWLYWRSDQRTLRLEKLRVADFVRVKEIVVVGSPRALMMGLSLVRSLALNGLIVGVLGRLGMAVMTVCVNAFMLTSMFITGTNDTLLPIVGTLFGEKDYRGIRFAARTGFKFMVAACVAMVLMFLIIPGEVARLFGIHSQEGMAMVIPALRLYALSLLLYGINTFLQSFYQITGRVKLALLIVSLNNLVLVVLFAFLLAQWNADLIWMAFFASELATLLIVLCIGVRIRHKERVAGVLMIKEETQEGAMLDITIPATTEAANDISEKVIRFCGENGADGSGAMRLGIAIEEMAVNTALYGHKKRGGVIDVLVRVTDEALILRLRDDGMPFNPSEYREEEKESFAVGGIEIVRRLATEISYSRQLGFNVTIITVSRTALNEAKNI